MGRNSLGKILNDFGNTSPENNYMHINYNEMPKRNLLREYEYEYMVNRDKIDKSLESLAIKRRNDSVLNMIKNLENDTNICPYKMFNECEKLRKSMETVPSVPSGILQMTEPGDMTEVDLHRYYGLEIYNDCIMWNISPDWKGECSSMEHRCRIEFLKIAIDMFFKTGFYFTRYKYVIECGKEGNHTHAHCVLELNPKMKKSVATWLKSNIGRDFRAIWNRLNEGIEGDYKDLVKSKYALQKIILRTSLLRDDKLDYLIEEKKPFSHQNAEHESYPVLGGDW